MIPDKLALLVGPVHTRSAVCKLWNSTAAGE